MDFEQRLLCFPQISADIFSASISEICGKLLLLIQRMFTILWQYKINPAHREAFLHYYNPEGEWVKFFRQSKEYHGTELLVRDADNQVYITLDRWTSQAAYERFKTQHREQYASIDRVCEAFTVEENHLGNFFSIGE